MFVYVPYIGRAFFVLLLYEGFNSNESCDYCYCDGLYDINSYLLDKLDNLWDDTFLYTTLF